MKSQNLRLTVAVAIVAGAFVACAPPRVASTATTAADVARPSGEVPTEVRPTSGEAIPTSREAPSVSDAVGGADVPAGQLVCRTKSPGDGTNELFLEWTGAVAKGVLRTVAPSGMVHLLRVQAERSSGLIVADDPSETDLVMHAAVVRQENGKQHMRLGNGTASWSACE